MERDDLIVNDSYALNSHHSEEAGVKIRKNIIKVTVILTVITIVEVLLGAYVKKDHSLVWDLVVFGFITMTIIKARYIVMQFMHLGDERNNFRKTILYPYIFFIVYAIILISILEGKWQGLTQILPF